MHHTELRKKFLDFFKAHGHAVIPSASLVPLNDPTVLFTTAGMHPLVPYLLGQEHPAGKRLVDVQKCVRTGDIDEVGDDTHLTFFEMLGNWSLGDYFKQEAIQWSFDFLTSKEWLNIPLERLAVTCFGGDENAPRDDEAADIWKSLGMPTERIAFLGKEDNWWGPAGQTGPCGSDTEMFYWIDNSTPAPATFDPRDKRWVEIWNDVFMQYNKTAAGTFEPLAQKNVDTGMGLERTLTVLNGKQSVYETELFVPIMATLPQSLSVRDQRIVADHARAVAFIIADGVEPSNKDRGYVLRRLLRRMMVHLSVGHGDVHAPFTAIVELYGAVYPELTSAPIREVVQEEADKFSKTVAQGLRELDRLSVVNAAEAFTLYESYGLPYELIKDIGGEKVRDLTREAFDEKFKEHQELSRTASAGQFKGGLADHSELITRYHTATHLLNAALRKVLGDHVMQKGSNITAERTRFDFSHPTKMTDAEKSEVERLVNEWIEKDLPVVREEMSHDKARELGAIGAFGEKYGDTVSVYTVGDPVHPVSREFCGGPHVTHTGVIGAFKILKEEAVSSGVRRIKAVISE